MIRVTEDEILHLKTELPPIMEALAKFDDLRIKGFVRDALEKAPEGFWLGPCSSSGKYHPPFDHVIPGGIVNHTLAATYFVEEGIRRYPEFADEDSNPNPHWLDLARAATMLHDIGKCGIPWGEHTVEDHGFQGMKFLAELKSIRALNLDDRMVILGGVKWHMGRWEADSKLIPSWGGFNAFELLIQEADYYSTRKRVRVAGFNLINYECEKA